MSTSQFIDKLVAILKDENSVQWTPDGEEFEITDLDKFKGQVLQEYFRHRRLDSFIRQLNMYGFQKVNRRKNAYIFHHPNFTQQRPQLYGLIKRCSKKVEKVKEQNITRPLSSIVSERLQAQAPNMAELLKRLIQFNTQNGFDHRHLKSQLEALAKEISSKKLRVVRPIINVIKEKLSYLEQIRKRVESIDLNCLVSSEETTPSKQTFLPDSRSPVIKKDTRCVSAPVMPFLNFSQSKEEIMFFNQFQSVKSISNFLSIN